MFFDDGLGRLPPGDGTIPVPGAFAIDVTDGDDLHARIAEEAADVVEPLVAGADEPQGDPLAGGWLLGGLAHGKQNWAAKRQGRGCGGVAEELPAC